MTHGEGAGAEKVRSLFFPPCRLASGVAGVKSEHGTGIYCWSRRCVGVMLLVPTVYNGSSAYDFGPLKKKDIFII